MGSEQLREANQRLEQHASACGGVGSPYFEDGDFPHRLLADEALVFDWVNSVTDPTPIDEAWLRSIGFREKKYQDENELALNFQSYLGDPQWIATSFNPPFFFFLCRWSDEYEEEELPPDRIGVDCTTRGQLRRICAAMGLALSIPLKDQVQS